MIRKFVVRQAISPGTSAALKVLAEQLREAIPANWAGVDEDWDAAIEVTNDEGIPLIWVPRGNIVGALMSASGTAERHTILIGARDDVVADCLAQCRATGPVSEAATAGFCGR